MNTDAVAHEISNRLAAQFHKVCKTCGTLHTRTSWKRLPLKGRQVDAYCTLELRDCPCGSTLAAIVEIHDLSEE